MPWIHDAEDVVKLLKQFVNSDMFKELLENENQLHQLIKHEYLSTITQGLLYINLS